MPSYVCIARNNDTKIVTLCYRGLILFKPPAIQLTISCKAVQIVKIRITSVQLVSGSHGFVNACLSLNY